METVSIKARLLIENLLHVHALANMARASDNERHVQEHFRSALGWLPRMEETMRSLREELERSQR